MLDRARTDRLAHSSLSSPIADRRPTPLSPTFCLFCLNSFLISPFILSDDSGQDRKVESDQINSPKSYTQKGNCVCCCRGASSWKEESSDGAMMLMRKREGSAAAATATGHAQAPPSIEEEKRRRPGGEDEARLPSSFSRSF